MTSVSVFISTSSIRPAYSIPLGYVHVLYDVYVYSISRGYVRNLYDVLAYSIPVGYVHKFCILTLLD